MNAERKIKLSRKKANAWREKQKNKVWSFQPGRGRFNIFITLMDYCGGYPRARGRGGVFLVRSSWWVPQGEGVRKIVHGYPWGDEFPAWSFEVARCVFVYTYNDHLCPLYWGGGTYSELVCMGINILLYMFILIYVYKHICMCICMYIFPQKNIEGLLYVKIFLSIKKTVL